MIDDNTTLVDMVTEYFKENPKMEVTLTCKDGEEGLDTILYKSSEYDVILLDLVIFIADLWGFSSFLFFDISKL